MDWTAVPRASELPAYEWARARFDSVARWTRSGPLPRGVEKELCDWAQRMVVEEEIVVPLPGAAAGPGPRYVPE